MDWVKAPVKTKREINGPEITPHICAEQLPLPLDGEEGWANTALLATGLRSVEDPELWPTVC
jgi:hypothetical protein